MSEERDPKLTPEILALERERLKAMRDRIATAHDEVRRRYPTTLQRLYEAERRRWGR